MRKFKLENKYLAGIAAVVLAAAGIGHSLAYAGNAVDLSKPCSLTLNVAGGSYAEDLEGAELTANIYQVASMEGSGVYHALEGYEDLGLEDAVLNDGDWSALAKEAAAVAEGTEADAQITLTEGSGTAEDLEAGMYLVVVENGVTDCYEYTFSPYLISLPDNLYYQTNDPADNEYLYDVTGGLKPEQSPRYGNLKIVKTLESYNTSLSNVTFVFEIEAVDQAGTVVYSNVVSTTHQAAGSKEVVIEGIPAGSTVTVKEVYGGASYEVTGSASARTVIVAEDTVTTEFANNYTDQLLTSYGATNHFEYDDNQGWQWKRLEDNSAGN